MDPAILEPLFKRALKSCKFFPKISEILEPLQTAKKAALPEAASEAWQIVLAIRREHFNPDFPRYLASAVAQLSERVQRAARASGVFQEVSDLDQLHVWAKKRFVDSYLAWEEIEENQFLLPDGELKALLTDLGEAKALPVPRTLPARIFPYTPTIAAARETQNPPARTEPIHETPRVIDSAGRAAELQRQAELIKAKYPPTAKEAHP